MQDLGAWLGLLGGFLIFMLFISAAQTLDRHAEARWGYRPLALPNLAFMLMPHGLLAAVALQRLAGPGGQADAVPIWAAAVLAAILAGGMFWIIRKRTAPWVALAATLAMCAAASVLLASMLFRTLAEAPPGDGR